MTIDSCFFHVSLRKEKNGAGKWGRGAKRGRKREEGEDEGERKEQKKGGRYIQMTFTDLLQEKGEREGGRK